MNPNKSIFFTSDHHFGIPDRAKSLEREKLFVRWIDEMEPRMQELYIMGDLFDFWFEYKTVIPRGYALLLGRLAQLCESGIPVHYFRGNHDMWTFDYFEKELGFIMYREPIIREFGDKKFYLGHGDGLGPGDKGYKLLKRVFENRVNQWLFKLVHPEISMRIALYWSRKSRHANLAREGQERAEGRYENLDWLKTERLPMFAAETLKEIPDIDYFVFGHWHLPVKLDLGNATYYNIGDWINYFSYLEFDGNLLEMKYFENSIPKV